VDTLHSVESEPGSVELAEAAGRLGIAPSVLRGQLAELPHSRAGERIWFDAAQFADLQARFDAVGDTRPARTPDGLSAAAVIATQAEGSSGRTEKPGQVGQESAVGQSLTETAGEDHLFKVEDFSSEYSMVRARLFVEVEFEGGPGPVTLSEAEARAMADALLAAADDLARRVGESR
jgi:hypothetical protein